MALLDAASIFAYGQTSSGKTYTMVGITEYSMSDIYGYIDKVIGFIVNLIWFTCDCLFAFGSEFLFWPLLCSILREISS